MDKFIKKAVDLDRINTFINGRDPMERIVNMEYTSTDNFITIYYRDEKDRRCSKREEFYPFVWATRHACLKLCDGDRSQVSQLLKNLVYNSFDFKVERIFFRALNSTIIEAYSSDSHS